MTVPQSQPLVDNPPPLDQEGPTVESIAVPKKRAVSAETSNGSKRAKVDAAVQQQADSDAAHVVVKKERETIDLTSDDQNPEPETDNQRQMEEEPEPHDLAMYLRFRTEAGRNVLKDFDDLPTPVQAELMRRYKEMWSATKNRRNDYTTCTTKPARYTDNPDKPWCIRNLVVRGSRGTGQLFSHGGDFKDTADDRCVNASQPCAHFARHKGKYIIRFVPLPMSLREGTTWTDLGYWVL